ncbi:phage major capsid protein [bacterium]|nr:phage major capsid protein [bacterium]
MDYFQSKKLREERAEIWAKMNALSDEVIAENRAMSAEEMQTFDNFDNDIRTLDDKIASAERVEKTQELRGAKAVKADSTIHAPLSRQVVNAALKGFILNNSQKSQYVSDEMRSAMQRCSLTGPSFSVENRALEVGTPTGAGYFTQEQLLQGIIQAVKAYGGMRNLATVIQSANANPLPWIVEDNTSTEAVIRAEGANTTFTDNVIGKKTLGGYVFTTGIKVTVEMLRDSYFDLLGYVSRALGERLARGTNRKFCVGAGSGSDEPWGLLTRTSAGVTTSDVDAFDFDDLIDLEHSVDPGVRNMGNCQYQLHDSALKVIRKIKDDNLRYIWQPSPVPGVPSTINGYSYTVNQHYEAMGTDENRVLTFGDHSYYTIRDVGTMDFVVLNELYRPSEGAIGFMMESTHDADLIVPSGFHPVKHLELGTGASA